MLVPKLNNDSHIPREYKIINVDFVIEVILIQYLLTKAFMMTLSFVLAIVVIFPWLSFFKKKLTYLSFNCIFNIFYILLGF